MSGFQGEPTTMPPQRYAANALIVLGSEDEPFAVRMGADGEISYDAATTHEVRRARERLAISPLAAGAA